jgi:hypothetical protein
MGKAVWAVGRVGGSGAARALGLLLAFCLLQGCGRSVTVLTDPPGARVQIFQVKNGVQAQAPVVDKPAPVTQTLSFPEGVSYKVIASMPQFLTDDHTLIEKEPKDKSNYPIALTRYLKDVPYIGFVPHRASDIWTLVPERGTVEGYILQKDYENERLNHIRGMQRVTNNDERPLVENHEVVDIRNCSMSPTADVLIYQKVTERVLDETEHVTPKDEKAAETLAQVSAAANLTPEDVLRDNPDLPQSGPLPPLAHVHIRHRELTSQVWKQVIDKPIVTPISPNNILATFPGFSFNGDSVLFASDHISLNALLWRMQVDAGGPRMVKLTSSDSLDYQPSGGQQYLSYTSLPRRSKMPQVWLARPDGNEPSLVREGESSQISPAGDRVLYTKLWTAPGGKTSVHQLWTMDINGGADTQLTQNQDFDVIEPRWDPDGKWIVYASNEGRDARGVRNFDIWLMTADGRKRIQLTSDGSHDSSPSFDRTGRYVYFRSNRGGFWNVWRCELTPEVRSELGQ